MVYNKIVNIIKKGGRNVRKDIDFDSNSAILNEFVRYLQYMNFSTCTIKAYESDLRQFFHFILDYKCFKIDITKISIFVLMQIKKEDVYAFLVYLNYYKNNSSYTKQRKLISIKVFYKWLIINNQRIDIKSPVETIPNIEPSLRLPKVISLDKAKQMQEVFTKENCNMPLRNNAIISLLLSTGMRASELININIEDINFNNNTIKIIGKGKKYRIVYFSNYCKEKLKKYLWVRSEVENEKALFLNARKNRISINGIEYIVKKAFKLIGLDNNNYSPHTLRHTAATIMLKSTGDILLVKEFLGHKSITSTQTYTHVYKEDVKNAVEKNPLSTYTQNNL